MVEVIAARQHDMAASVGEAGAGNGGDQLAGRIALVTDRPLPMQAQADELVHARPLAGGKAVVAAGLRRLASGRGGRRIDQEMLRQESGRPHVHEVRDTLFDAFEIVEEGEAA